MEFRTEGFDGYSLCYSPFDGDKFAYVGSQHFGIAGKGRLSIFVISPQGLQPIQTYDTADGIFDCSWSEQDSNSIVTASGDGVVRLWNSLTPDRSISEFREHNKEACSVHWNLVRKDVFASSSWDNSVKIWSPERTKSLSTLQEHQRCVFSVAWSPYQAESLISGGGDRVLKLWDVRHPRASMSLRGHDGEILSVDWNKYDDHTVVSGSVDRTVRVWDLRTGHVRYILKGHDLAVRRVKCSPFDGDVVASSGYDMTLKVWNGPTGRIIKTFEHHSEFVVGFDFSLQRDGEILTCGWDQRICLLRDWRSS